MVSALSLILKMGLGMKGKQNAVTVRLHGLQFLQLAREVEFVTALL